MTFNVRRVSDWLHAVERWEYGDPGAVADFVRRYGVEGEHERDEIARMLLTHPDPRKMVKPSTVKMLQELRFMLRCREQDAADLLEFAEYAAAHLRRLRSRLARRGWHRDSIEQVLRARRPFLFKPHEVTMPTVDDVRRGVAERYGVSVDSLMRQEKRISAPPCPA